MIIMGSVLSLLLILLMAAVVLFYVHNRKGSREAEGKDQSQKGHVRSCMIHPRSCPDVFNICW